MVELCSSSSGEVDVNFRLMWVRYSHEHSSSPYIIKNKVLEKKVMKGDLCDRPGYALLQVWVLALVYLH